MGSSTFRANEIMNWWFIRKVTHGARVFYLILEREGEMLSARTRKQITGGGMEGERVYVFAA